MKDYTVVGLYHDNKQVWVGHIKADDVEKAVIAAKDELASDCHNCDETGLCGTQTCAVCGGTKKISQIAVLSVFEGEHKDVYGGDELIED